MQHAVDPRALPLAPHLVGRGPDLAPVVPGRVGHVQHAVVVGGGPPLLLHQLPGAVEQRSGETPVVEDLRFVTHLGCSFVGQHVSDLVQVPAQPRHPRFEVALVCRQDGRHAGRVGEATPDVVQRQVDGAQPGDEPGRSDLLRGVPAGPRAVHPARNEQADAVVMPQRLRGQPGAARELSHAERTVHVARRYGVAPREGQYRVMESVRELRLVITVDDYDAALAFYRDVLGLVQEAAYDAPNGGRVTLLGAGRATVEIADVAQAEYIDDVEVGSRVAGPLRVAFEVRDAEGVTRRLASAGAEVIAEPTPTPWNSLNARMVAPDGLQLPLFEERG